MPKYARYLWIWIPVLTGLLLFVFLPKQLPPLLTVAIVLAVLAGYGILGGLFVYSERKAQIRLHMIKWMAESIPGGIFIVDHRGRYSYVSLNNPRIRDLFPEPEAMIGRDYREYLRSLGRSPADSGVMKALENGESSCGVKIQWGGYSLSSDTVPLRDPKTGIITGAAIYWRDVTEEEMDRKLLQEITNQYQALAYQFEALFDTMPMSVLYIDQNAVITTFNQTFESYYPEFTRSELLGMNCRELARKRGTPADSMNIIRALNGEHINGGYTEYGDQVFLSYAYPIYDPDTGHIIGAAALYQDITEIELLRREITHKESLSLIGQMAASITHEIRNPMAAVRGFIQLLHERNPDAFQSYYRIIRDELDRANDIINDFLALAQNRMVEMEDTYLNDIILSLEPIIQADANLRGISLRIELQEGLPLMKLSTKEIKQLLLNLSRNALEVMDTGGVLAIRTEADRDGIRLLVRDTGPGIPAENLDKLFQPFFTTKETGTGLGLAVCSSIVKKHNGTIEAESEPGNGTLFTIRLPAG